MRKCSKYIFIILLGVILIYCTLNCLSIAGTQSTDHFKIVLDPGHGGNMPGSVNYQLGLIEKDLTLKVARYLREYLEQYDGVEVIMTHDGNLPNDYELELPVRGMIARNYKADLMVSLHFNDSSDASWNGAEVYVTNNKLLPKYYEQSAELGNRILGNLVSLGISNRGVKTRLCSGGGPKWEYSDGSLADYYAVIRYPMKGDGEDRGADLAKGEGIPAILVEHCFINGDGQFIDSEQELKNLAIADGEALVAQYGLTLKSQRVQSIILNKTNAILAVGEQLNLTATIEPKTALNKKVNWSSSDPKIAIVNENGEITPLQEGRVIITAITEDKGLKASVELQIEIPMIAIEDGDLHLLVNHERKLTLQTGGRDPKECDISWKSSDSEIVEVSSQGKLATKKVGEATITAKIEGTELENSILVKIQDLKEKEFITIKEYQEDAGLIYKIGEKVTKEEWIKNVQVSDDIKVVISSKQDYIGNGTKVQMVRKSTQEVLQDYTCLVYGDVNGDGLITPADYVKIKNHIMEASFLTGFSKLCADVDQNNDITPADYVKVKNHIMKVTKIEI